MNYWEDKLKKIYRFRNIFILISVTIVVNVFSLYSQEIESVNEDLIPLNQIEQTETKPAEPIPQAKFNVSVWDYIRMILILACVIGAIYLLFFFLKKGVKKKLPQNDIIKLLSSYNLPGNSVLFLVEVGTNIFFIGSGDGKVNLLSEIKDKESLDTIRLDAARLNNIKKMSFSDTLLKLFKTTGNMMTTSTTTNNRMDIDNNTTVDIDNSDRENHIDFIKRQRNRLEKMR